MGPHVYNCMYTYTYVHVRMYILCTDTSYMYNYISYVRSMLWKIVIIHRLKQVNLGSISLLPTPLFKMRSIQVATVYPDYSRFIITLDLPGLDKDKVISSAWTQAGRPSLKN